MKTKLQSSLALFCMLTAATLSGQIPNNGFENWTNAGSYWTPDGWWTPNDSATGNYVPVSRSTDHYPVSIGDYSMRMENNVAILPDWGAVGVAWTGGWEGNDYPVFPVNGHPVSLYGYYKFSPQNNDTMEIHIRLYKNGVDVSGGQFKSADPASSWTSFQVPFSAYADADSARIMILSCYDNDGPLPHGNSVLYIDNLSFDSLITDGIADLHQANNISIYPNPAKENLSIAFAGSVSKQTDIIIYNAMGQPVFESQIIHAEETITLDISRFAEGIYFIQLLSGSEVSYYKKFMINR